MGTRDTEIDDRHYLINEQKIKKLLKQTGIGTSDHVMELGAGIGSIARHVPRVRKLTLIDIDSISCGMLRSGFMSTGWVKVRRADGLEVIQEQDDPADILLVNLPFVLTHKFMDVLALFPPRLTLLSTREGTDLTPWQDKFNMEVLMTLDNGDFFPPQPFASLVVKLTSVV